MTTANPFPDGSDVLVRFPRSDAEERGSRAGWPWLPGWITARVGPDEWQVCVQAPELAGEDGDGEAVYPCCYRSAEEIRAAGPGRVPSYG